jgi:hypothetical protein
MAVLRTGAVVVSSSGGARSKISQRGARQLSEEEILRLKALMMGFAVAGECRGSVQAGGSGLVDGTKEARFLNPTTPPTVFQTNFQTQQPPRPREREGGAERRIVRSTVHPAPFILVLPFLTPSVLIVRRRSGVGLKRHAPSGSIQSPVALQWKGSK